MTEQNNTVKMTAATTLYERAEIGLDTLCEELQVNVVSFLEATDAVPLMLTRRRYYDLIMGSDTLWKLWFRQRWPFIPDGALFVDETSPLMRPDFPRLLGFASTYQPPSCLEVFGYAGLSRVNDSPTCVQLSPRRVIRHTGIKADSPLPKPNKFGPTGSENRGLLVVPYVREGKQVVVTPQLCSYFEVTFLDSMGTNDSFGIGVSTKSSRIFPNRRYFPGWDPDSFAYHSDNGGIYNGSLLGPFGPTFGQEGDTVGCGVDYEAGNIFFTLNGRYLGCAWTELNLTDKELYPTLGLHTCAVVECNFGRGDKFRFDLRSYQRTADQTKRPSAAPKNWRCNCVQCRR